MNKTQEKLVEATERLLLRHGLDKAELLLAVSGNRMGEFREVLNSLPLQVGLGTVRENLERTLQAAYEFQYRIVPIVCSLFADVQLLDRTREILRERQCGPECVVEALAVYLQAEQRLGRIGSRLPPRAEAEILLASGFHTAMLDHLLGRDLSSDARRLRVKENVQALMAGLEPRLTDNPQASPDRNHLP
jgi:AcrR family transcriptional regulator